MSANITSGLSDDIAKVAALLGDQVAQERAWLCTHRAVVSAPYAGSLTPTMRRMVHRATYYIFSVTEEMYKAHQDIFASLGVELLRDELLVAYRGRYHDGDRLLTVTSAGAKAIWDATKDRMVCEMWEGQAAAEGYGSRWVGVGGDDPTHPGQSLDLIDGCQFADCECGSTLIGNLKAMACPSCGRITWGT